MKEIFDDSKTRVKNHEHQVLVNNGLRTQGVGKFAALFAAVIMLLTSNVGMAEKIIDNSKSKIKRRREMKFNFFLPKAVMLLIGLVFFATTSITSAGILTDEKGLAWASRRDLTSKQFSNNFNKYRQKGFMMIDLDAYPAGNGVRYSMIWRENTDGRGWAEHRDMTFDGYRQKWNKYKAKGFRPHDVEAYQKGGRLRWAGIWVENKEGFAWSSHRELDGNAFSKLFNKKKRANRPADIEVRNTAAGPRYAVIWYKNTDNRKWALMRGMTRSKYQQEVNKRSAQGMRVVDFESYRTNSGQRYAAIWERRPGFGWQTRTDRTEKQFADLWQNYLAEGYRLVDFERYDTANGPRYAGIWAENFTYPRGYAWPQLKLKVDKLVEALMAEEKLPGMTIAASVGSGPMHRARLVATLGFGKANTATNKPMKYFSRILQGSTTKALITGPALWQLMKAKGIDPKKQTLYGQGGLFKNNFKADILKGIAKYNPTDDWMKWYEKITIQNLLDHRSGFKGADSKKAAQMFKTTTDLVTYEEIHRHFLRTTQPLFEPGTAYKYDNHNFGVLGMLVITKLSGKSYQSYVQQNYLKQWGLNKYITPSTPNPEYFDANPHVPKNGNPVPIAFWDFSIRPAAGGFTASAQDLIKLMVGLETKYKWDELDDMGWKKGAGGKLSHNGRLDGGTALAYMFPAGYTSSSGRDLSYVKVVVMTPIWTGINKLTTLVAKIANEVALANIPKTYDIWKIKQAKPSLAKMSLK